MKIHRKHVIRGLLLVFVIGGFLWLLLPSFLWEYESWVVETTINEEPAKVSIQWRHARFIGNHVFHIGGGNWKYRTEVKLHSGNAFVLETQLQPRAIWKAGDSYYVACSDTGSWFIGKLETDGSLVEVSKSQVPHGPTIWNLEKPETQSYWQKEYSHWAQ